MAISAKKLVERMRKKRDSAVTAVFAAAPNSITPFHDCYCMASDAVRDAYDKTISDLIAAEEAAICAGKAYRASFGMLTFYR